MLLNKWNIRIISHYFYLQNNRIVFKPITVEKDYKSITLKNNKNKDRLLIHIGNVFLG